jgi:O-antigen/teichoic acid export membrane protein
VPDEATVLARGGLLNLVGTAVYGALGFVFVLVVTRGLGASDAGAFFEAVALFSIVAKIVLLGADIGLVRFIARSIALGRVHEVRPLLRVALVPVLVAGVAAALLMFLGAAPLARLFADEGHDRVALATYSRVLAPFVLVAAAYGVLEAASRAFGTMLPSVAIEKIGRSAAQPLLLAVAIGLGGGSVAIGASYALPYLAGAVALAWWVRELVRRVHASVHAAPPPTTDEPTKAVVARDTFWRFTGPRAVSSVFQVALLWLDVLLIGALASSREAGIYAAATRYVLMGNMAGQALTIAIQPQVSALLARGAHRRAGELFQIAAAWTMAVSWPVFVTVLVFRDALLRLLGPGFAEASPALVVLAAAWLFASACGPIDVLLLMAGASGWNLANTAAAVLANVVCNIVLVPRWGITGAAVAWAISVVIANVAPAAEVWRLLRIHPFGRGSAVVGVATGALVVVELAVRAVVGTNLAGITAAVAVGGAVYLGMLSRRPTLLQPHALRAAVRRVSPATR